MGDYQNYGPFLGILNVRCRIIIGTQKRDHNFDNYPHVLISLLTPVSLQDDRQNRTCIGLHFCESENPDTVEV